ncbi:MAG: hypothetical protein H6707_04930 [Deltaproteobacteria bacterium]|nr:hypothetical protein [Deltaproteobacteria bacterium]
MSSPSETPGDSPGAGRPPLFVGKGWKKNPYVWAAVAGVLTIPLLKPFLRRIPDPPAVLAQLADRTFHQPSGRPVALYSLRGRPTVMQITFDDCANCQRSLSAMRRLWREYDKMNVDIGLVTIVAGTSEAARVFAQRAKARPSATEKAVWPVTVAKDRWQIWAAEPAQLKKWADRALLPHLLVAGAAHDAGVAPQQLHDLGGALALIDPQLGLRGIYPTSGLGPDEVLHRSIHVMLAARK